MKITIEIDNIDEAQAIAIEDFLSIWQYLGNIGSSRWTAFFADGDGSFHPKIKVDGRKAETTELVDTKKNWHVLYRLLKPTAENGFKEAKYTSISDVYMIDYDEIAWILRDKSKIRENKIKKLLDI